MKNFRRLRGIPLMLATAVLVACDGVGPTGPMMDLDDQLLGAQAKKDKNAATMESDAALADDEALEATTIIDRRKPLKDEVSTSAVIGRWGGKLFLKEAGIQIWVPEHALTEDTEITVTALAGNKFAIDMQPHGLQFAIPVEVHFNKKHAGITEGVFGAYFSGDPADPTFLEFFKVGENPSWLYLETTHFSGYALASGSRGRSVLSGANF